MDFELLAAGQRGQFYSRPTSDDVVLFIVTSLLSVRGGTAAANCLDSDGVSGDEDQQPPSVAEARAVSVLETMLLSGL